MPNKKDAMIIYEVNKLETLLLMKNARLLRCQRDRPENEVTGSIIIDLPISFPPYLNKDMP